MPLLGLDSVFICGAKSVRDFDDWDMPASNKPKKKKPVAKKPPTATRTSQLREGLNAKEKRKSSDVARSLESSINNDELTEQQQRLQNLEHKQEIQTLKNQNIELLKENEQLKESLDKQELTSFSVQTELDKENEENDAQSIQLDKLVANLQKEKENMQLSIDELRTSKEVTDQQNANLLKERESQNVLLQCAQEQVENYKKENENLKKVQNEFQEKSQSGLDVEKSEENAVQTMPQEQPLLVEDKICQTEVTSALMKEPKPEEQKIKHKVDHLMEEISGQKERLEVLTLEREDLQEKFDLQTFVAKQLENVNGSLMEKNESLEHKLRDVQDLVNTKNMEINAISSNLEIITRELDESKKNVVIREEDVARLEGELATTRKDTIAKNEEIDGLNDLLKRQKVDLEEFESALDSKDERINQLNKFLKQEEAELIKTNETKNEEIKRLRELLQNQEEELTKNKKDNYKKMRVMEEQIVKTRKQKEEYEDRTHQLQSQIEDLAKEIKALQILNEKLQKSKDEELNVSVFEEVQFEQKQNSFSPFMERTPNSTEPEPEVKLLRQQIDEQQFEMEVRETSFKSEVSELQKSAEYQEHVISKLELDNSQLRKQTYELNETILSHEDKIRTLINENSLLTEQLQEQTEYEKEKQVSNELIAKNEREDTEKLLKIHKQEIESYRSQLNEYEQRVDELIQSNEKDASNLESQLTALQIKLELKCKDYKKLLEECELLRRHKEQEFIHRDEQELYLLREIERVQHECRQRISSVEEDRDKQISNLNLYHDEKMMKIELECEQLKTNELEIAREDFKNQLQSLINERDELLLAVKRLESLLSKKTHGNFDNSDSGSLNGQVIKSLSEERENHKHASREMLNMLTKLDKRFEKQYENSRTNKQDGLNNTWPMINQSGFRNGRHLSSSHSDSSNANYDMREQLEQARADIAEKMEDLDNTILSINSDYRVSTPIHHSLNNSIHDTDDGLHPNSIASSSSSVPYGLNWLSSSPSQSSSPALSSLRKDMHNFSSESSSPKSSRKKQLKMLFDAFQRLDQQCRALENENIEFSHESWYKDLQAWKQRAIVRLNLLQQRIQGHISDEDLINSIVFRPSDHEVRNIIADVNDKYDRMSNGLGEY